MNKTPQELIDDLKAGTIKYIIMGSQVRSVRLTKGVTHGGIDAVVRGQRGRVTETEALQFVELANGGGIPITIE